MATLEEMQLQLNDVMKRMDQLEARQAAIESQEPRWKHLIYRPHSWRRQLFLRDRNMTVGQLVYTIRAEKYTPEQASEDFDLPIDAIHEALTYYAENRALIEHEVNEERRHAREMGIPLEPEDLHR
jgi:uncharacterized protein (DUF433 family)